MGTIEFNGRSLTGLKRFNVLLGKNGCGKSRALKGAEETLRGKEETGAVRYISPERHGFLTYEPGVDQNIEQDANWLPNARRTNQAQGFKQQSAALYRRLELDFLRELQEDHSKKGYKPRHFNEVIKNINSLLDRIEIKSSGTSFHIFRKEDGTQARAEEISSGESELIALAIEILSFRNLMPENRLISYLFLDEPDVHLHPDLQEKLADFLIATFNDANVSVIIATHSTSFVGALAKIDESRVAFMKAGDQDIAFEPIDDVTKIVLPVFGTHPLSNIFNKRPILIVEGEDDQRLWDQAVRTSGGKISLFPCVATSKDVMNQYEKKAAQIIDSVYDRAVGFSIRDRDDDPEEIDDFPPIIRMRLSSRTAENLMLTDDALSLLGIDWKEMTERLRTFVVESPHHPFHGQMKSFLDANLDRKNHNLKEIRNVVVSLMTSKPWEVLVGQAIAKAKRDQTSGEGSMRDFVGEKAWAYLLMQRLDGEHTDDTVEEVSGLPTPVAGEAAQA